MKNMTILFLTITLILTSTPVFAADNDGFIVVMDIVIARPFGLAALVIGSAFFAVTYPFAAMSNSVHETADTLVGEPYRFTFLRPPGDFSGTYMAEQDKEANELQQPEKDSESEKENKLQKSEDTQ